MHKSRYPFLLAVTTGCLIALWLGRDFLSVTTVRSYRGINFAYELNDANAFLKTFDEWLIERGLEKTKVETALTSGGGASYYYRGRLNLSSVELTYRVTRSGGTGAWTISDLQTWNLGRVSSSYRAEIEKLSFEFEQEVDRWIVESGLKVIDPR